MTKQDNTEKQIILLTRISTLKDMQIYCLREEEKLHEELNILKEIARVKDRNNSWEDFRTTGEISEKEIMQNLKN
jgi:hypothetical protein